MEAANQNEAFITVFVAVLLQKEICVRLLCVL